jgi:cytochrome c oxidase assembly protein subunit 11
MNWEFRPVQRQIEVKVGESSLAFYRAANLTGRPLTGSAVFNVTPPQAGAYFAKIECFCFTEQTLEPGQTVDMPVQFFVDPSIEDDVDLKSLKAITLSYTFYPAEPSTPRAPESN